MSIGRDTGTSWVRSGLVVLASTLAACGGDDDAGQADAGAADAAGPDAADAEVDYRAFADQVASDLAAQGVPGGALAIVRDGKLAFAAGLGVKEAGGDDPVGPDTSFRIGSLSKTFAATAILSLAGDQVVVLDEPITTYAPDLALYPPDEPSRITIRELLSHTAGIPDHFEVSCSTDDGALGAWFADRPNLALWSPPGRLWSYSNLGFSLAALVAERAAGVPFRELVGQRVLAPLEMTATTYDTDAVVARGDYAVGHADAGQPDTTLTACALADPPGYLYSTAHDLARFTEAFLAGGADLLDASIPLQLGSPQRSTQIPADNFYGLGTFVRPYNGAVAVYHGGDLPGFHTSWVTLPELGFGVVVLINGDGANPGAISQRAIDTFLALPDVPPTDYATPPAEWEVYTGSYASPDRADAFPPDTASSVVVTLEGEHLLASLDGEEYELHQIAGDSFYAMIGPQAIPLTFWLDGDGRGEYIATRLGALRRVEPPAAVVVAARTDENLFERLARLPRRELDALLASWL